MSSISRSASLERSQLSGIAAAPVVIAGQNATPDYAGVHMLASEDSRPRSERILEEGIDRRVAAAQALRVALVRMAQQSLRTPSP
jgi:hypothetical protein